MNSTIASRIKQFFIQHLTIQIFLSLVSLPIIVAWGLPLSWLSPIGNLLFTPILSLFLLLASLAFFSELIGITNIPCLWLLEYVTTYWQWFLGKAPFNALCGFYAPSWVLLFCIALIALLCIAHPRIRHPHQRLITLTVLLIISIAFLRANEPRLYFDHMPCHQGTIVIYKRNNTTIVIDPGYIGSRISAPSWISYTFVPELLAKTGSLTIDYLILLKPNIATFNALHTLLHETHIGHIYLPYMQGELQGSLQRSFNIMYATLKNTRPLPTRI